MECRSYVNCLLPTTPSSESGGTRRRYVGGNAHHKALDPNRARSATTSAHYSPAPRSRCRLTNCSGRCTGPDGPPRPRGTGGTGPTPRRGICCADTSSKGSDQLSSVSWVYVGSRRRVPHELLVLGARTLPTGRAASTDLDTTLTHRVHGDHLVVLRFMADRAAIARVLVSRRHTRGGYLSQTSMNSKSPGSTTYSVSRGCRLGSSGMPVRTSS